MRPFQVLAIVLAGCGVNTEPILADKDAGREPRAADAAKFNELPDMGDSVVNTDAAPPSPDAAVQIDPDAADAPRDAARSLRDSTDAPAPDAGPPPLDMASGPDPIRDESCDDGRPLECDALPAECEELEVAAVIDGCWLCVNAVTCRPWGEPGCELDADCAADAWCNECATGSCPFCEDCVAGCSEHECETAPEPVCDQERPLCEPGEVSVVRDGCWVCVQAHTCEPGMACAEHADCGRATCRQEAEICVAEVPTCVFGDHCEIAEHASPNLFCSDGGCERCGPGDEVRWTCPDGNTVAWCRCDAGGILCRGDPSGDCADD